MKLIMERWRKFVKEESENPTSQDLKRTALTPREKYTKAMLLAPTSTFAPEGKHAYAGRELQKLHPEILRTAITMIDPTGISSWPDLPPAYRDYKEEKSAVNLFFLILAVISIIPVVGGLGKTAKAEKLRKSLDKAEDLADTLESVEETAVLGKTLKEEIIESRESLDRLWHYVHNSHDTLWDSPEFLEGLLKLNKTGLSVAYVGPAYRGLKATDEYDLLSQINIVHRFPGDEAAEAVERAIYEAVRKSTPGKDGFVYVSFESLEMGATVSSREGRGLIPFTKNKDVAHEFATTVGIEKWGSPKISAILHTSVSASDEVFDIAETMRKVDDTLMPPYSRARRPMVDFEQYLGSSSRVRHEEELLMFGDSYRVEGIWIKVNE